MQRSSVMFRVEGVDGAEPRMVARSDLIQIFAAMAQSDLRKAHDELGIEIESLHVEMEAGDLLRLLESHTRAVNALQALLAFRHPDELVEAHLP